ncbi:MAG: FmdB family zinc ribbon protein [Pseudomonadota bacterium]
MPIYAYKCGSCGHAKDVLQKISDAPLTVCPACGAAAFGKQVTAAGFQLKGSGWYATDFRNGNSAAPAAPASAPAGDTATPAAKPAEAAPAAKSSDAPTASAGSCGGGCACH